MKNENIISLGINSLCRAYAMQKQLLEEGNISDLVNIGKGEDQATRGDWESEEAVINYLRMNNINQEKPPLRIIAEEHGIIDIVKNPRYLLVLDGIDGSSGLVKNPHSRCGTMISIANSLNPDYKDFIFAGITEYATNRIIYGFKGKGVYIIENFGEESLSYLKVPNFDNQKNDVLNGTGFLDARESPHFLECSLQDSRHKKFSKDTRVIVDCYNTDYAKGITKGMDDFEEFMERNVVKYLENKVNLSGGISSASMCVDLLTGNVDAVFNMVAKGVFEPPAMYFLTKELGGEGTDLKGNDLGNKKWEKVGMNLEGVLFSSSKGISKSLIEILN